MVSYQYKCVADGVFEVSRPMGTASRRVPCPRCAREAQRVYSAPMFSVGRPDLMSLIERTEKSGDEPDVVTRLPPRVMASGARISPNPMHTKLPRR